MSDKMHNLKIHNSSFDVMIIDDNKDNLSYLVNVLKNFKEYNVRPILNAELAISSIESKTPDIILLDIKMPCIDGFKLCKTIKSNKEFCDIPVIFVSGLTDYDSKIKGFSIGASDFICKPFNDKEIIARVNLHISLRNTLRQLKDKNELLNIEIQQRLKAEKQLKFINQNTEETVKKRTEELSLANKELLNKEKQLLKKNESLLELNKALKNMLDQRNLEKKSIEISMVENIKEYIGPYLDLLHFNIKEEKCLEYLNIINRNIDDLVAPIESPLHAVYEKLTPSEVKTVDLIRQGKSTKEIADIMVVSPYTVSNFRYSIRKKLKITNKKRNLKVFLENLV
ncbi:response regulator [Desulforhopalus singaporensis]|nr:response regulator [Desulforhopalus singaporensis]